MIAANYRQNQTWLEKKNTQHKKLQKYTGYNVHRLKKDTLYLKCKITIHD